MISLPNKRNKILLVFHIKTDSSKQVIELGYFDGLPINIWRNPSNVDTNNKLSYYDEQLINISLLKTLFIICLLTRSNVCMYPSFIHGFSSSFFMLCLFPYKLSWIILSFFVEPFTSYYGLFFLKHILLFFSLVGYF